MTKILPYRLLQTNVVSIADININLRRVTLTGPGFADFKCDRPGQWMKLFFTEDARAGLYDQALATGSTRNGH